MITGKLELFTEDDLDALEAAVLRVLERTGMRVLHPEFLHGLAIAGAPIDETKRVARYPARMVSELIDERRDSVSRDSDPAPPGEAYRPGLAAVIAPFIHDHAQQVRREATRQDLVELLRWAEADIAADQTVGLPVTMRDVDPRVEPIEAYAILLETSSRPDRAYTTEADQIEFLVDIATAYYGRPVFPRGVDFTTSPLTFGDRLARHTLAALRFGQREFGIGVMPISGTNAPMTVAGNIVVSAAELLGSWLAIRSLAPDAAFTGSACNGVADMRRGAVTFDAPEALLADLGLCELFDRRYGGGVTVAAGADYIDARLPGLQAAYERTYRSMAIAAFTGGRFFMGGNGTLDEGKVFSPVQYILEREMGEGLWRLGRGIQVDADTLAVETIDSVGATEAGSYLNTRHTKRHCRDLWFPQFLCRGQWEGNEIEFSREADMLDSAHEHYVAAISRYVPPELDRDTQREMWKIVARARELLGA